MLDDGSVLAERAEQHHLGIPLHPDRVPGRYTVDEVERRHRSLAEHLRCSVLTGTYGAYRQDPTVSLEWDLFEVVASTR